MSLTDDEVRALGFDLPQGSDLISEGDNNISRNARAAANLLASSYRVREQPPQGMTTLDSFNRERFNGIWQIGPQHGITDAPFPITTGTLFEVRIGSPANAGKQVVSDSNQSWWREAAGGGSGVVTSWGAWRKSLNLDELPVEYRDTTRGQFSSPVDLNTFREANQRGRWVTRQEFIVNGPDLSGTFIAGGTKDILWLLDVKYYTSTFTIQELHPRTDHFDGYYQRRSHSANVFGPWTWIGDGPPKIREWRIFLAAGQSNMSGRGMPVIDEVDQPDYRILEYGNRVSTTELKIARTPLEMRDTPTGLSPAMVFAREYLKEVPSDVGIILVPAARGGSGFRFTESYRSWDPEGEGDNLYWSSVAQVKEAQALAGSKGVLSGVLWHQGEADAGQGYTWYRDKLLALVRGYRAELSDTNLPFVIGQMTQENISHSGTSLAPINAAQQYVAGFPGRAGFAQSDDGWHGDDYVHFGRHGVEQIGRRYVEAYQAALTNAGSAPIAPPTNLRATRVGSEVRVRWDSPHGRWITYRLEYQPVGSTDAWTTVSHPDTNAVHERTITSATPVDVRVFSIAFSQDSLPATIRI